ncbi:MAG TPA: phage tail protein [Myxococcota bacterium]|nr:phage tail protein [Myxococcota bacterium]HQK51797.1 phage tail protein [Myxococcota bacterium]
MAHSAATTSGGPPSRGHRLPVPDLVGLDRQVAVSVLASAGFSDPRIRFTESYEKSETVLAQQPEGGTLWDSRSPVTLTVSKASLIRFLPAIYRPRQGGDPSFLRDFLWIIQHLHDSVNSRIDGIHQVFRPSRTPPEFLPWLASWFGIFFDDSLDDARRRRLLREAPGLFRIRGTREALVRWVFLFTGLSVEVLENRWPYQGFRIGCDVAIGVQSMILPEVSMAHAFVVRVPMRRDEVPEDLLLRLHRVIEAEKPASTNYFLQFADVEGVTEVVGMRIGVSSLVGVEGSGMEEAPAAGAEDGPGVPETRGQG